MNIKLKKIISELQLEKYKLFVDLDGTLCDFDKQFKKISNSTFKTGYQYAEKFGEERMWNIIIRHGLDFWTEMEFMPDGKHLWNYIQKTRLDTTIISKPAKRDVDTCKTGKIIWCKRNLGPHVQVILEDKKYIYANENNILIDDLNKNIVAWEQHGGIAILHTSAEDTIKKLRELGI